MFPHFAIETALGSIDSRLTQEFFERLGHRLPGVDWLTIERGDDAPVLAALRSLPREAQNEVESVLAAIFELACPMGWQAILQAARQAGGAGHQQQRKLAGNLFERAMQSWLLDPDRFEQAILIHRVGSRTGWPRPRQAKPHKRASRAALIELLSKHMKDHIIAAQEHARSTAERHGLAELLPRPSQRLLAKLTRASESAVSRCLHDPAARELRLLWEIAGDLDRLLALPPRR